MRVNVHFTNFELTDAYKKHIKKRIYNLYKDLKQDVSSITIRLDVQKVTIRLNNTSEKLDLLETSCTTRVETKGLPLTYSEHTSTDMDGSVIASAHQAHEEVSRNLRKLNSTLVSVKENNKAPILHRLNAFQNQQLQSVA